MWKYKELPKQQEHFYRHSFDIKSSKVFTYMVVTTAVLFCFFGRQLLLVAKQTAIQDDALKFRIIRVWRGCSPKEILWLNDVFDIHRNKTAIKNIKKQIDGYELGLKQKADSLMQRKIVD